MERSKGERACRRFLANIFWDGKRQKGVDLILCKDWVNNAIIVVRKSDNIISLKLDLTGHSVTTVSKCAPRVCCAEEAYLLIVYKLLSAHHISQTMQI